MNQKLNFFKSKLVMRFFILCMLIISYTKSAFAQEILIRGKVSDAESNISLAGAIVKLLKSGFECKTDSNGFFTLKIKEPGFYVLSAELTGYKTGYSAEQLYTFDKSPFAEILLDAEVKTIGTVNISKSAIQNRKAESPVSAQQISIREIERNPGGNRDISKIVQSLPGVIAIPGFRNDIIIRGGSPAENKFYLDGIEIPIINHFQTQGSTGGPVGVLNVNFIKEVNFYTGAFPMNMANGMSAVVDFKQTEGNKNKPKFRFTLGSSDLGFTADGPIGKKTTFIGSVRQSYLQGLFSLLKLPFLPNFIDYQVKLKTQLTAKDELIFIGLGAFDFFKLNEKVNKGITDSAKLKNNNYILGYLPDYSQWNYTIGAVYTHYTGKQKRQVFLSRSQLYNVTKKYKNNDESNPSNKILDYSSDQIENKLRFENNATLSNWKNLSGVSLELAEYAVKTYNKISIPAGQIVVDFSSKLNVLKYAAFTRFYRTIGKGILLSAAARLDGSDYNSSTLNVLGQPGLSFSISVPVKQNFFFNANIGQFHQLPAYTVLGYRNGAGELLNKNTVQYIRCQQAVAGFQWNQGSETKITLEGFYKQYSRYPVTQRDSISLGNLGADFAVTGNEPIYSTGKGKAYGLEFLMQRRSRSGLYGILSYTLAWSKFTDKNGNLVASSWDSRHTLSLVAGIKLKKNWEIGSKWRFVTGRPFTPANVERSLTKTNWDIINQALPDYSKLNSGRLSNFNQLDFRVDKVWYFKHLSLNLYLDIQNIFNSQYTGPATLIAAQDGNGNLITNPSNTLSYKADYIQNTSGTVLPTLGIILDF
jgi:hypothetical protein